MRTDLFDFDLPAENIALRPAHPRDSARMLVVQPDGLLRDRTIADLPQWLEPGDQLVVNDTRVISAQLSGRRIGRETEAKIDATLIKRLDGSRWQALVRPAKKLAQGDVVRFGNEGRVCLLGHLDAVVEHKGEDGEITLSFSFHGPALDQAISDLGSPPLPPYRAPNALTVTVTPPGATSGDAVTGALVRLTDFDVTLYEPKSGQMKSWLRNGDTPKVVVTDPLQGHVELLPKWTDADMHNVTAYLAGIK